MRKLSLLVLLAGMACTTAAPPPAPAPPSQPAGPYALTVEEEARVLALEDRREYDPAAVAELVKHPNPLHRVRVALALGRIHAGIDELGTLASDSDRRVREMAAFALGEIGDIHGADTLFYLAGDSDAAVAAEAVEALSKLASDKEFVRDRGERYLWMLDPKWPEGVRARATRFLFRFDNDKASDAALRALSSPSSAVRQEGAYALARRAFFQARAQLELVLTDPNTLTRAYAATALGRIGAAESIPALITALGDVHPWVRTNAAVAIGRIADKHVDALREEQLPRVFAAMDDPDPGVRASMIDVDGYYARSNAAARKRLVDLLKNGSMWERELAAGAVAKHLGMLSALPDDLSPWQQVRVIEATAATPAGIDVRKQYASSPEALVRAAVLGAIGDDRADAEIDIIRAALHDPDVVVRANAYDRFAATSAADRLQILQAAEEQERTAPMNDGRLAAINGIARSEFPERADFLTHLLKDDDPVVRRVAADLIVEKLHAERPHYTPLPVTRTPAEYEEIVRWSREPHTATIHMTRGKIELALLTQDAPMTAWNFAQLAKKHFFDNTSFMRVVPNFVIQGGDPRNDMSGGPGYAIRDEINLQKYTRGAVGMALSGPDTGGSQFFITHSPQPHLDGGYTIFARVYEGMTGVVDQTERGDRVETITIDEHPPVSADQVASVPNVSLPLEIGPTTAAHLLDIVPDYAQRKSAYTPDITVVEMMKQYVHPGDRVEVYMGTWCSDSQREVPKLLRILDELHSQFGVELPVTYVAVDRSKQQPAALIAGKDLQKVATFIYYRGDREVGRIVEKPDGLFEDDLLAIAAKP